MWEGRNMEVPWVQKAFPYGETYCSKVSFIDLLPIFAFQKVPQDNCFLLAQLCSSGLSMSAHRLWHIPFSPCPISIPIDETLARTNGGEGWRARYTCTQHTVYLLYLWCIPSGEHAPQSCFLIKPCAVSPKYHWIWFVLNLHLTKIRTSWTFSSKFSIISKPYWFILCFYTFAAQPITLFTLPNTVFFHFVSISIAWANAGAVVCHHVVVWKKKRCKGDWNTRGMLWGPDKHFNTCKKKGVWAFGTLRKVQALTTSSHKHHLKVDEHTVLPPFHREGSGHRRITQHSSLDGLKKYRNGTIRKEKQAYVEKTMITGLEREC